MVAYRKDRVIRPGCIRYQEACDPSLGNVIWTRQFGSCLAQLHWACMKFISLPDCMPSSKGLILPTSGCRALTWSSFSLACIITIACTRERTDNEQHVRPWKATSSSALTQTWLRKNKLTIAKSTTEQFRALNNFVTMTVRDGAALCAKRSISGRVDTKTLQESRKSLPSKWIPNEWRKRGSHNGIGFVLQTTQNALHVEPWRSKGLCPPKGAHETVTLSCNCSEIRHHLKPDSVLLVNIYEVLSKETYTSRKIVWEFTFKISLVMQGLDEWKDVFTLKTNEVVQAVIFFQRRRNSSTWTLC